MENREVQVKFEINVSAYGIKKRCRKIEGHSLPLGYIDYKENLSSEELTQLMEKAKAILATNMKSTNKAVLRLYRVEIGDHFKTMQLFDERHKSFQIELGA